MLERLEFQFVLMIISTDMSSSPDRKEQGILAQYVAAVQESLEYRALIRITTATASENEGYPDLNLR